jgi:hypothetical protein
MCSRCFGADRAVSLARPRERCDFSSNALACKERRCGGVQHASINVRDAVATGVPVLKAAAGRHGKM